MEDILHQKIVFIVQSTGRIQRSVQRIEKVEERGSEGVAILRSRNQRIIGNVLLKELVSFLKWSLLKRQDTYRLILFLQIRNPAIDIIRVINVIFSDLEITASALEHKIY